MEKKKLDISRDTRQNLIIIGVLLLAIIIFSSISKYFLKWDNIVAILVAAVPLGLVAISESNCLMVGGFDMSVGFVACFSGIIWTTLISVNHWSTYPALAIALLFGLASGTLAGASVALLNMPPWMTTFALMNIWQGCSLIVTGGDAVRMTKYKDFKWLGQADLFAKIPPMVILLILIYIIMYCVHRYTKLGRDLFVVGGNPEAAKNAGINAVRAKMFAFMISGFLAALAGALFASRSGSGQPKVGTMYAMQGIAAATIGGTKAGKTNLAMTFVGAVFIMLVQNGLNMIQVPAFYQYITTGVILVLAILLQTEKRK